MIKETLEFNLKMSGDDDERVLFQVSGPKRIIKREIPICGLANRNETILAFLTRKRKEICKTQLEAYVAVTSHEYQTALSGRVQGIIDQYNSKLMNIYKVKLQKKPPILNIPRPAVAGPSFAATSGTAGFVVTIHYVQEDQQFQSPSTSSSFSNTADSRETLFGHFNTKSNRDMPLLNPISTTEQKLKVEHIWVQRYEQQNENEIENQVSESVMDSQTLDDDATVLALPEQPEEQHSKASGTRLDDFEAKLLEWVRSSRKETFRLAKQEIASLQGHINLSQESFSRTPVSYHLLIKC